jgi:hypothetical protein
MADTPPDRWQPVGNTGTTWGTPGAIVELTTKYLKIPEGLVEGYAGIGRKFRHVAAPTSDHGVLPASPSSKRDSKRQRVGSPEVKKSIPNPRQSSPLHEERCCGCTKYECKSAIPPRHTIFLGENCKPPFAIYLAYQPTVRFVPPTADHGPFHFCCRSSSGSPR